jgi:hypothetical protein
VCARHGSGRRVTEGIRSTYSRAIVGIRRRSDAVFRRCPRRNTSAAAAPFRFLSCFFFWVPAAVSFWFFACRASEKHCESARKFFGVAVFMSSRAGFACGPGARATRRASCTKPAFPGPPRAQSHPGDARAPRAFVARSARSEVQLRGRVSAAESSRHRVSPRMSRCRIAGSRVTGSRSVHAGCCRSWRSAGRRPRTRANSRRTGSAAGCHRG